MSSRLIRFALLLAATSALAQSPQPARSDRFESVYRKARGAVVSIITRDATGSELAQGSGFAVTPGGKIVTNLHVLQGATTAEIRFADGSSTIVQGSIASDLANDLAVLTVDRPGVRFLKLADSTKVTVGAEVLAIGNPLSLEATATNGIVSALRSIDGTDVVQTSASISPGSSGGPLLNLAGEVVGVTTWYFKNAQNLNFAVATRYIRPLLGSSVHAAFPAASKEETVTASKYDYSRMKEDQAQMNSVVEQVESVPTHAEKVQVLRRALAGKTLSLAARAPIEMLLGAECVSLRKNDEALTSFEAALTDSLDAHIHIVGLYHRLCDVYVYFRRPYEAVDMSKAAVAEAKATALDEPTFTLAGSWTLLGRAYKAAGRVSDAIDAYNSALSLEPGNAMANRDLFVIARALDDQKLLKQMRERLKSENEPLWKELFP